MPQLAPSQWSDSFFEALLNTRHRVLGERLAPFSLRHVMWLEALGSPIVALLRGSTVTPGIADLRVFVAVCSSRDDRETWAHIRSWRFKFKGLRRSTRVKAWRALQDYIADYWAVPRIVTSEGKERPIGAPWVLNCVLSLCKAGLGDFDKVFNFPVGLALWMTSTLREMEGSALLGDKAFDDFMEKRAAREREKKGGDR